MTAMPEEDEFTAIIFCPCCCSTVELDKEGEPVGAGKKELECTSCGTEFTVVVDPDKFREHALN